MGLAFQCGRLLWPTLLRTGAFTPFSPAFQCSCKTSSTTNWTRQGSWLHSPTYSWLASFSLQARSSKIFESRFCNCKNSVYFSMNHRLKFNWIWCLFSNTFTFTPYKQLSNLLGILKSVSIVFCTAMKSGSLRRFKRYPTTYRWVSSQLPFYCGLRIILVCPNPH